MIRNLYSSASLLAVSALASMPAQAQEGPPGMVLVAGGRYDIGIDKKEAVALVEESQVGAIVAEYPQYSARLDDFYYMPTEVTNEQFAAFVRATGSEPPRLWGKEAIDDATRAFAERVGKAAKDARDAGLPVPEFEEFDPADWWENNWQDCEWEIPTDISAHPVVYISYERAEAYARWAGLRLISEEEHQAVGRGDDDLRFPWGDEWIEEAANCTEANRRKSATADVGSYPLGASWFDPDGKRVDAEDAEKESALAVHDICGNVWEWTRTPYAKYPKFKPLEVKMQGEKKKLTPEFDANNRTAVSGHFGMPPMAIRVTSRRNTARWQATDGVGMRCSASAVPAQDIAESILRMDLPTSKRPADTVYLSERVVAIDRWQSERGTAKPEHYRIITAYDYLAFLPVEETGYSGVGTMKNRTAGKPLEIGAFSTTVPLIEPALEPGTYTLSWRAGAELERKPEDKDAEEDGAEPAEPEFPFDPLLDTLIFRDTNGKIVAWQRCDEPQEMRMGPGRVGVHSREAEKLSNRELNDGKIPRPAATVVTIHAMVPMNKPNKAFEFTIPLAVTPGTVDDAWRR